MRQVLQQLCLGSRPRQAFGLEKSRGLGEGFVQFGRVFAAAAGIVRFAAAFAADNRRDLLNDFAGLNYCREVGRDRGNQRDTSGMRASAKNNDAFEAAF